MQLRDHMKKILIYTFGIFGFVNIANAQIIDTTKVYKKRVLENTEIDLLMSNQLTEEQRAFLKANKVQIMDALLMTTVYTPSGTRMKIKARDSPHQAWLIAHNHNSPIPILALDTEATND